MFESCNVFTSATNCNLLAAARFPESHTSTLVLFEKDCCAPAAAAAVRARRCDDPGGPRCERPPRRRLDADDEASTLPAGAPPLLLAACSGRRGARPAATCLAWCPGAVGVGAGDSAIVGVCERLGRPLTMLLLPACDAAPAFSFSVLLLLTVTATPGAVGGSGIKTGGGPEPLEAAAAQCTSCAS